MTDKVQSGPRLDESGLEHLLAGLTAVRGGDFSTRLAQTGDPLMDEIATVFNAMAAFVLIGLVAVYYIFERTPASPAAPESPDGSPLVG